MSLSLFSAHKRKYTFNCVDQDLGYGTIFTTRKQTNLKLPSRSSCFHKKQLKTFAEDEIKTNLNYFILGNVGITHFWTILYATELMSPSITLTMFELHYFTILTFCVMNL